ncbi:hypothetical protein ACHAW6_015132 [Cyclotella cf. meneghiniana]
MSISWEEGLQQLTAFGESHGHFSVPSPVNGDENHDFYKWVQLLHIEYRSFQNGHGSTILNESRISSLVEIGFEFNT